MITREAIHHIPKSNYSYGYDKETLHLRIKTKKGEVKRAYLRIGDPYIWDFGGANGGNLSAGGTGWQAFDVCMEKEAETEYFDHFIAKFNPKYKRSRYAFILEGEDEKVLFTEKKIYTLKGNDDDLKVLTNQGDFFCFPYLNNTDVAKIPNWVKDTVWYQIFPDRFCSGDKSLDEDYYEPWGSTPTSDNFMGGDLQGVIDKLDYLKDLGINGIYFCPIFDAYANHRYDTIDYMEIDKRLGDKKTLKTLVKEAHKRGIKIMLDAVFNHIGFNSPIWQDVVKNGENSRYKDWFCIHKFPVIDRELDELDGKNLNYETFGTVYQMPKLNTENEEAINYLIEVGKYWIKEFDIDAWRLDVSNEVDHKFWRRFRDEVKSIKEDVYILGEIWHDSLYWLMGDQFDSVMNYPLSDAIEKFICKDEITTTDFKYRVNSVNISYPMQITEGIFNLVDSHDTARVISTCCNNKEKAKLAYLFMFTQAGCPCIYYGDEIGMDGEKDNNKELHRKCMVWEEENQDKDMLNFFKKIIKIRKENEELKLVENDWILTDDKNYNLILRKKNITIIINNSNENKTIKLPSYLIKKEVYDLFDEEDIKLSDEIYINKFSFMIIKQK